MGATNFMNISKGQDAQEAFKNVRERALHNYGHGGYTGSIAEKSSFIEFEKPKGMRKTTIMNLLNDLSNPWLSKEELQKKYPKINIEQLYTVYDDKWGPAVAIQVTKGYYGFAGIASE